MGFGLGWGVMVQQTIRMARALGIPTIDGVQYFNALERPPNIWHSTRTEANHDIYLRLFEDARNVAYAITPHGSYSTDDEVPLRHVVAGAVPPQGGSQRVPPVILRRASHLRRTESQQPPTTKQLPRLKLQERRRPGVLRRL